MRQRVAGWALTALALLAAVRLADGQAVQVEPRPAPPLPAYASVRAASAPIPALQRVIALELDRVPLRVALTRIATSADLRLTYSTDIIPQRRVSLRTGRMTTAAALRTVLRDTDLDLLVSAEGDAILVHRSPHPAAP